MSFKIYGAIIALTTSMLVMAVLSLLGLDDKSYKVFSLLVPFVICPLFLAIGKAIDLHFGIK